MNKLEVIEMAERLDKTCQESMELCEEIIKMLESWSKPKGEQS